MLNYRIAPELLVPFVPRGCELDVYDGHAYVSVVGFLFADTRVRGLAIPFHRTFEEVNLRFYVRRVVHGEVRRAVTFLREFVPRRAIAYVARWLYNEPYRAVPMSSEFLGAPGGRVPARSLYRAGPIELAVETAGSTLALVPGSLQEFIAEHYWGYTAQRDGGTIEYRVAHRPWRVAPATSASLRGDLVAAFGTTFAPVLAGTAHSAWLADGSPVTVFSPTRLTPSRAVEA